MIKVEDYTKEQIDEMRCWVADCVWADLDEDYIDELSDQQILRGVNRHYEGGISQFMRDAFFLT